MDKKTGTIITIVLAVLTLCCSLACCVGGVYTFIAGEDDLDVPPAAGIPGVCLAVLVWIVPVVVGIILLRGKDDGGDIG